MPARLLVLFPLSRPCLPLPRRLCYNSFAPGRGGKMLQPRARPARLLQTIQRFLSAATQNDLP